MPHRYCLRIARNIHFLYQEDIRLSWVAFLRAMQYAKGVRHCLDAVQIWGHHLFTRIDIAK